MSLLWCLVVSVGIIAVVAKLIEIIVRIKPYLTPSLDLKARYANNKNDVWAVITGASEGIGRDWAIALSKKGFNIVLIARTVKKLEAVAKELNPDVKSMIIPKDFSQSDQPSVIEDLVKQLSDIKIGILLNNVGVIDVEKYHNLSLSSVKNHIKVNMMTSPQLIASLFEKLNNDAVKDNRRAIIVSMSSLSAESPLPYYSIYGATKIFLYYFGQSLCSSQSLSKTVQNVDLLTLRPYFTQTAMVNFKTDPLTITPQQLVTSALSIFGKTQNANGHIIHEINSIAMGLVPEWLLRRVAPGVTWKLVNNLGFIKNKTE